MSGLEITFDEDGSFVVTVDCDVSATASATYRHQAEPPHGGIVRSLFEISAVFTDDPALLIQIGDW